MERCTKEWEYLRVEKNPSMLLAYHLHKTEMLFPVIPMEMSLFGVEEPISSHASLSESSIVVTIQRNFTNTNCITGRSTMAQYSVCAH